MKDFSSIRVLLPLLPLFTLITSPSEAQFTQQGEKLVGTGAIGASIQGISISISGDGNTAILGGYKDNSDTGAAWIFTRSGGVWTQQGNKLSGSDVVGAANQGVSVSLSADGNTAIVGGWFDSTAGAAWVYTRIGNQWIQQGSKLVGTGAVAGAYQGISVSLSADGNTAIVGGFGDSFDTGAVWIFTRSGGIWTQQGSKLVGSGAVGNAQQGVSVDLSGDGNIAIVGGWLDDSETGAAWIFSRSGGVWTQQGSKLVGMGSVDSSLQGWAVSISADGTTALVGGYYDNSGTGAGWVFVRTDTGWTQQGSKLVGSGAVGGARQGVSVSLSADGNTAIMGGFSDNSHTGASWLYTRDGAGWNQLGSKLVGTGAVGSAYQGISVSISADGNTVVSGGYRDNFDAGAGWVFVRPAPPSILSVNDVSGDQGGQVRLIWGRSAYDNSLSTPPVSYYSLWRKSPASSTHMTSLHSHNMGGVADSSVVGYDYVLQVPAVQSPEYQTVIPTLEDSSASGTPYFSFVVVAHTIDLFTYFVSDVDSGYSVDNLSPIPPAGLFASVEPGPQVELTWNPPTDPDVGFYKVYRSTTGGFNPTPEDSIGKSNAVGYTDTSPVEGTSSYYRIIAVDVHDNESTPSNEAEAAVTVNNQFSVHPQWNIISVPLSMSDYTKTILFPTATSSAFTFEDGYVTYGTLENGRGYWMKFSAGETVSHDGLERTEDTIAVASGWNMVGSLSSAIPVANVGSVPGGIVTSNFFGYDGGYSSSATLDPGKGYWVKVSEAGQLVMSTIASPSPGNRIRIQDTGEIPPPPPDQVNSAVPTSYALEQNYPNPFNPVTSITYALPMSEHVRLSVFNLVGQEVMVLFDETQEAGYKSISFDAGNLPSGVYTYRITAGTFTDVKKMLLLK